MSILQNAIDSIALGLEDYEFSESDERRIISCARNIYAGILLLFKHKISSIDESSIWIGNNRKKTIDYKGIKNKFEELNIAVDWDRIDKINIYRNSAEHYFSSLTDEAIQGLISNSFIIIRDFISEQLQQDPKELLGSDSWSTLIEIHEVYEKEKEECNSAIETLDFFVSSISDAFTSYSCEKCGSDLIYPTQTNAEATIIGFICKSCDKEYSYEEIVVSALENYYAGEMYIVMTDGGDSPLADCPFCGGTYLYDEQICAECGERAEHVCKRCGEGISPEELNEDGFCGYCSHVLSKDD